MVKERSLVIAVIGIVVLGFVGMAVWSSGNSKPVAGNAMFNWRESMGNCAVFNPNSYNSRQLENYCRSYCLGRIGYVYPYHVSIQGGTTECCCSSVWEEPAG